MVWTKQEAQKYRFMTQKIDALYAHEGISPEDPESRSEYLTKIMNLSEKDSDVLKGIKEKNGEAIALILLEHMVIEDFTGKDHSKTLS